MFKQYCCFRNSCREKGKREMKIVISLISLTFLLAGCQWQTNSDPTEPLTTTPIPPSTSALPETCIFNQEDPFREQRQEMVRKTIEMRGVQDPNVLKAMNCVPRHEFVPAEYLERAYGDHPLPIGYGQTISQPYIVAWMTELIELAPGEKVLEIGTGSGYQAAVLAELGDLEIFSIEIVPELAENAAQQLDRLGYSDVQVRLGDGYYGWEEESPFDAIIVTAAPNHLPGPLAAQLAEGGRLVIPIGPQGSFQTMWVWVNEDGDLKAFNMGLVSFVPLTGEGVKQAPAIPPY
jgi:protein-L-isoaspartate(D-aspartate) O-methyltransferase